MREIKFRGKRVDNGEWVYGNYFIDERDIEDGFIWREIPQIQQRYGDHYQYFDIINDTIGQYAGLKDKNGREIYEGDIIAHKGKYHTVIGQILFGKIPSNREVGGDQGFYIKWQNNGANEWDNWWRHDMYYWTEQVEVIGNIHDNSELLEVSE